MASHSRAIEKSFDVRPPSEWVLRVRVTLFQRMSMSGWWSLLSACLATRLTKSTASVKPLNSNLRRIALEPGSPKRNRAEPAFDLF